MKPHVVDDVTLAFPAEIQHLLPTREQIPPQFWRGHTPWNKLFSDWFYGGITITALMPKPEIDTQVAMRHLRAIIGSYQPQHEHKEAAVAYLLSEWFYSVTYESRGASKTAE